MPFCFAVEMSLTYDANGNLITGDGKYRTYNSLNQLWKVYNGTNTSVLLEEYTYHPIEERVIMKKVYNTTGAVIETTYYISQNYVQVVNLTGTFNYTYYYLQGNLVAQDVNGVKTYFATDAKGDVIAVLNSSGNVTETDFYSPTGEITLGGNKSKFTYEGKELDKISGMTDYNARMMSSATAQFTQPDTLIQNVYDPQNLNRFSFERNNPYKNTDPTGHKNLDTEDASGAIENFNDVEDSVLNNHESQDISDYKYTQHYTEWCSTYICEKQSLWDNPTYPFEDKYTAASRDANNFLKDESRLRKMDDAKLQLWSEMRYKGSQINSLRPTQNAKIETIIAKQVVNIIASGKSKNLSTLAIKIYLRYMGNTAEARYNLNKASGCTATKNNQGGYNYKC